LLLRRRVPAQGPPAGAGGGLERAHRLGRGPDPPLLLPLRSVHRTLQPRGPERGPRRRHPHPPGARTLHLDGDAPRPPRGRPFRRRVGMIERFRIFPEQASTLAPQTDALLFFLLGITTFFVVLIAGLIIVFMIRYRRRDPDEIPPSVHGSLALEIAWT